jgi:hypothetical protein
LVAVLSVRILAGLARASLPLFVGTPLDFIPG